MVDIIIGKGFRSHTMYISSMVESFIPGSGLACFLDPISYQSGPCHFPSCSGMRHFTIEAIISIIQFFQSSLPIFLSLSEHSFSFVPCRALTARFSPLAIPSPPFSGSSSASSIPIFSIGFMSKILSLLSELFSTTTLSDVTQAAGATFLLLHQCFTTTFSRTLH